MIGVDIKSDGIADALSLSNPDAPASDITNSQYRDALANSILDAPIVGNHADPSWAIDSASDERHEEELYDSEVESQAAAQETDAEVGPEPPQFDEEQHELLDMAEASQREPQPVELTPAEIHNQIAELDRQIEEGQLADRASMQQYVYDMTAQFGVSPDSVGEGFTRAETRLAVSSISAYQAGARMDNAPALSPTAVSTYAGDVLQAFGADPRDVPYETQRQIAELARLSDLSIIQAFDQHPQGLNAPLHEINSPAAYMWFANALNKACGMNGEANPGIARHLADARAKMLAGQMKSYISAANRQGGTRQQPRRSSSSRGRSQPVVPWRSNRDIFDEESVALYLQNHGRL